MKTTFNSNKILVEKGFNNLKQALYIILLTILSTFFICDRSYLLAGTLEASGDRKGEYFSAPAVSFQQVPDTLIYPTIEWDKTLGGNSVDQLRSIISTIDGGYLLAGTSNSPASGDKSEDRKGWFDDYWIVKIDAQGNKVWDKTIGGEGVGYDNLHSAIPTSDGGYLLAGESNSNASGDKSENSKVGGYYDYWIVKIDGDGKKVWDKTIGGWWHDRRPDIIATPDGGYLLAGYSDSRASGDKSENSKGQDDYWVVKIDEEGNKLWDKTLGGNRMDRLNSAISTHDGGYLLAGYSSSDASGDKSQNSKGLSDFWVVKVDEQGNKIWDKTLGGSGNENLASAITTPDGGYLLGGSSRSDVSGDKSENRKGDWDYWVVKTDAQGNKLWDKTLGGNRMDRLNSAISTHDGGYLLAGYSSSDASGDKSQYSKGLSDFWVVKVDEQGNKIWDKTLGGSSDEWYPNVIPTPDGGYLLAGDSFSPASGDKSDDYKGNSWSGDYWIVKIKEQTTTTPVVTSLTLMNAKTDQEVKELKEGDIINLAGVGSRLLNIRANASGAIDYVKLELQGPITHTQTEEEFPYALFGDYPTGDFKGREWVPGNYTLTATPYLNNEEGTALTVSFEMTDAFAITGFTLIDAQRNQAVGELSDGEVIDLATFEDHPLSIRAETDPMRIGKVSFALEGPITHTQIEKEFPYALFGDYPTGNYKYMKWIPGNYTLTATPYALDSMGVSTTINFTVIDSRDSSPEVSSLRVEVYPVPTSDLINILNEGEEEAQLMLLDFGGNVLLHQPLRQQPIEQLDVSGLRKGIYYLKVVSPEAVQVFRVVKE